MDTLDIHVQNYPSVDVVAVTGRVDSSNAERLESALGDLNARGRSRIVVDLSGIDYMSSMGIRALISAKKSSANRGGNVYLASPSNVAAEVIKIAGLEHVFDIHETVVSAVASF